MQPAPVPQRAPHPLRRQLHLLVEGLAHIAGVKDTETVHLKDEPGSSEAMVARISPLVIGHIIDQDVAKHDIDIVPLFRAWLETP